MYKIYLAGGMVNDWRECVKNKLDCFCYDPCKIKKCDSKEYIKWDMGAIKKSDEIVAYLENSNPFGANMALEIGYAKALNKYIVLIIDSKRKGFSMCIELADEIYDSLDNFKTKYHHKNNR